MVIGNDDGKPGALETESQREHRDRKAADMERRVGKMYSENDKRAWKRIHRK